MHDIVTLEFEVPEFRHTGALSAANHTRAGKHSRMHTIDIADENSNGTAQRTRWRLGFWQMSDSDLPPPSLLSSHSIRAPHVKPSASAFHTDPPGSQGNGIERIRAACIQFGQAGLDLK